VNGKLEHVSTRLHAELQAAVDETTYRLWLEPLRVQGCSAETMLLTAPPPIEAWVRQRFGQLLSQCARRILGPDAQVAIGTSRGSGERPRSLDVGGRRPQFFSQLSTDERIAAVAEAVSEVPPNPQLTFERFVIGESNRLAHGAALTIAELPGQGFNPLFICGPPGVGKTHLLHSISSFLLTHDPSTVVCLTSSEAFTNDFLAALQSNRVGSFKARFRRVDVLLVDDIQFLERKTRTEEEFFHTFNALYEIGSQIVMTSDRPPRDMGQLEARLRERFEAGLLADIHPPDRTTRTTILQKQIRDQGIALTDDVIALIADRVTASVRALEGALIRIVAFASLTRRPISTELTREVLAGLYPPDSPGSHETSAETIARIQQAACAHFSLTPDDLLSTRRARNLAWPRQLTMYLARELTGESLPAIGRLFGGRDHTTVLYACRRAHDRLARDPTARHALTELRSALDSPGSRIRDTDQTITTRP
jgi:chromosomal replication initiator protein